MFPVVEYFRREFVRKRGWNGNQGVYIHMFVHGLLYKFLLKSLILGSNRTQPSPIRPNIRSGYAAPFEMQNSNSRMHYIHIHTVALCLMNFSQIRLFLSSVNRINGNTQAHKYCRYTQLRPRYVSHLAISMHLIERKRGHSSRLSKVSSMR